MNIVLIVLSGIIWNCNECSAEWHEGLDTMPDLRVLFFGWLQATHVQVSLTEILNSVRQAYSREWYCDSWFMQMVPWHISRCRSCHQQHDGESFWCHCYIMIDCMISSWQALCDQIAYWLFYINVFQPWWCLQYGMKMTSQNDRLPTSRDCRHTWNANDLRYAENDHWVLVWAIPDEMCFPADLGGWTTKMQTCL